MGPQIGGRRGAATPLTRVTIKITRNTKNRIYAILAAVVAIPPKPKKAATIAMMKNANAQYSISSSIDGPLEMRGLANGNRLVCAEVPPMAQSAASGGMLHDLAR